MSVKHYYCLLLFRDGIKCSLYLKTSATLTGIYTPFLSPVLISIYL